MAPPRGSPRYGGRSKGTPNKATAARQATRQRAVDAALNSDITPLDVMMAKLRNAPLPDGTMPTADQFAAAVAAAPYVHARLATTTVKGDKDAPLTLEALILGAIARSAPAIEPPTVDHDDSDVSALVATPRNGNGTGH